MTDKEIIKAWEEEIHLAEYVDSFYCSNVEVSLIKSTLDLINRQQAEIERLKEETKNFERYTVIVGVGNNCLVLAKSLDDYDAFIGDVSVEAYKEFAKELQKKSIMLQDDETYYDYVEVIRMSDIGRTLKKLTEGCNENS